jgi:hypothetical protein
MMKESKELCLKEKAEIDHYIDKKCKERADFLQTVFEDQSKNQQEIMKMILNENDKESKIFLD